MFICLKGKSRDCYHNTCTASGSLEQQNFGQQGGQNFEQEEHLHLLWSHNDVRIYTLGPPLTNTCSQPLLRFMTIKYVIGVHARGGKTCQYRYFGEAKALFCYV